jgi:hypothetical protein
MVQRSKLLVHCSYAVRPQEHAKIVIPVVDSLDNFTPSLVGASSEKVGSGDTLGHGNHLIKRSALIGLTKAPSTLVCDRGDKTRREWSAKCARLHDKDLDTQCFDLLDKRLMDSLDGEFAGGIDAPSRASYKSVHAHLSIKSDVSLMRKRRVEGGEINIPSATANENDVAKPFCAHGRKTGSNGTERSIEVDLHLLTNFVLAASHYSY